MKYTNRESWLEAAVKLMEPHFKDAGYAIPEIRVACGWPSIRAVSAKNRRIGECWSADSATDNRSQIFISPYLNSVDDNQGVLSTLVHEVVHAVVGVKEAHNKVFKKCALAVGLEGKMTATVSGPDLTAKFAAWAAQLGEYPHAKLDLLKSPVKKQGTRMLKMVCAECGYVARTSAKWIEAAGPLHCPEHGKMSVDKPADSDEGGGDDDNE